MSAKDKISTSAIQSGRRYPRLPDPNGTDVQLLARRKTVYLPYCKNSPAASWQVVLRKNYGTSAIQLQAYLCTFISGIISLFDHDQIAWVEKEDFNTYNWAAADIPIVKRYLNSHA